MKRRAVFFKLMVMALFLLVCSAMVFQSRALALGGGGALGALIGREDALILKVSLATYSCFHGAVQALKATGQGEKADTLSAMLEEAGSPVKWNMEKTKSMMDSFNTSAAPLLESMDAEAALDEASAKEHVGKGALFFGGASVLDASAVAEAGWLVKEVGLKIKSLKTAPWGIAKIGDMKKTYDAAKFVSESVPTQLKSAKGALAVMKRYAERYNVEIPSAGEFKTVLQEAGVDDADAVMADSGAPAASAESENKTEEKAEEGE